MFSLSKRLSGPLSPVAVIQMTRITKTPTLATTTDGMTRSAIAINMTIKLNAGTFNILARVSISFMK